MVYESGFSTRRTYSSRPIVSSYSVSYPITRIYKTSYPIYSTYSRPYYGSRVISSPIRVVSRVSRSPSPVRVTSTTTRILSSPERTYSYSCSLPSYYCSSSSYLPSYYSSYIPSYYSSYLPSYCYTSPSYVPYSRLYSRSLTPVRFPPGYGARALTRYLSTEPFDTFRAETNRIRHRAQSLLSDLHTPVVRHTRSVTPFPVSSYEPSSKAALDAYVARITNPIRHVAKEVHNMSLYPEPARKYVGKSHLASVRICGDRAYNIRRPMFDSDRLRNDINLLSWYIRDGVDKKKNPVEDKPTIEEDPDLDPFRPSRKFGPPQSLEEPAEDEVKEKQRHRKERLLTVNEEMVDEIEMEKKKAARNEEAKRRQERALEEEAQRQTREKLRLEEEHQAQAAAEAARRATEEQAERLENERRQAEEEARRAEEERLVEEVRRAAEVEAAQLAEEARLAEEAQLAAEEEAVRLAEEARLVEEAAQAQEVARKAEEARLEEEQRQIEEELKRLEEIEKQAEEEREAELARQAAELAEIARQEALIAAQELEAIHDVNVTAIISSEPIVNEPSSPVDEAPSIELTSNVNECGETGLSDEEYDEEETEDEN